MGSLLCEQCTGACCRYIALPIEEPTTRRDFDDIRWYVMHRGISVFVEEDEWYVQLSTDCTNLGPENKCAIYETRPGICREYKAADCDYEGGDYHYDSIFRTPEQVEAYAAKKLGKKRAFPKADKKTGPRKDQSVMRFMVANHNGR